jgi:hypothetical protein
MRSAHSKLWISVAVVLAYTLVPVFAGLSGDAPAFLRQSLAGVPIGVLFIVALLFGFPLVAWLCASAAASNDEDGR